jgi:phage terminase small subunit
MECPKWLKGDAHSYWDEKAPQLQEEGILTAENVDRFVSLACPEGNRAADAYACR